MIQFQLPPDLIPSIFINEGTKQLTPLTIDYAFELEFLTEKQDRYKLLVPINIARGHEVYIEVNYSII